MVIPTSVRQSRAGWSITTRARCHANRWPKTCSLSIALYEDRSKSITRRKERATAPAALTAIATAMLARGWIEWLSLDLSFNRSNNSPQWAANRVLAYCTALSRAWKWSLWKGRWNAKSIQSPWRRMYDWFGVNSFISHLHSVDPKGAFFASFGIYLQRWNYKERKVRVVRLCSLIFLFMLCSCSNLRLSEVKRVARIFDCDMLVTYCENIDSHAEDLNPSIGTCAVFFLFYFRISCKVYWCSMYFSLVLVSRPGTYLNDQLGERAAEQFLNKQSPFTDLLFEVRRQDDSSLIYAHRSIVRYLS